MNATRLRFRALVEWVLAAAGIVALVAAGVWLSREYRTVSGVIPINVSAREAPAPLIAPPEVIPPGAVSLPVLLLSGQREIRIGDAVSDVTSRLGYSGGLASIERSPHGERTTRFYEVGGIRFHLVFEPFDQDTEPRLTAIYR